MRTCELVILLAFASVVPAAFAGTTDAAQVTNTATKVTNSEAPQDTTALSLPSPEDYAFAAQDGCRSALANTRFFRICGQIDQSHPSDDPATCFCSIFGKNQEIFCESLSKGIYDYCRFGKTPESFTDCATNILVARVSLGVSELAKNCGF